MSTRRGKKINPAKNYAGAKDFAAGKVVGRPKQQWVWDETKTVPAPHTPVGVGDKLTSGTVIAVIRDGDTVSIELGKSGHWEKVNVRK